MTCSVGGWVGNSVGTAQRTGEGGGWDASGPTTEALVLHQQSTDHT